LSFPETKLSLLRLSAKKKSMKNRKNNIWLTVGVIVICVLLIYWLFARTLIVEDENLETTNVPDVIEAAPGE